MGKKMRKEDVHKIGNNQVEEGNATKTENVSTGKMNDVPQLSSRDDDKNKKKKDNNEKKKDRIKRRKSDCDTDEKESQKARKKHKKIKDAVGEIREISMEACIGGKENMEQESSEYLENNFPWEGKRVRKEKHKKKNRKQIDSVTALTETLEHSKMEEPVEAQNICSTEDLNKIVPREEVEYGKRKKKKQKLEKLSGDVGGHIAVSTDGNDTHKEDSTGNKVECSKLGGNGGDAENANRSKKKKSKSVKNGSEGKHCKGDAGTTVTGTVEHSKMQDPVEPLKICSTETIYKILPGKEGERKKQKKKKKKKKKKQKLEKVNGNVDGHIAVTTEGNDTDKDDSTGSKVQCRKLRGDSGDAEDGNGRRKKKPKSVKNGSEGKHHKGDAGTRKSVSATNKSENATPKERSKRVSFCDNVEVFPCENVTDDADKDGKEGLVYGKRYSEEEDEIVMNAVADYIESHNLGAEGLNMVLNCRNYPQLKNCWKEIQAGIPWRPIDSVYRRAHVLYERDEKRPWTPEEYDVIHKFVKEHGPKWKLLADSLGKHRHHVKDTWRRIKLMNRNRGQWSQDEYQSLFDLVNMDLCMKASEERKSKHGMLRDNICWTAISDKMETRAFAECCKKWYLSLASPMVADGVWADVDDYLMLDALSGLDACCMEDVDWDNLIEHRSGELCRKRWSQMVRHLGPQREKSFAEQVEILANRYRPDMVEVREAIDSKVPVDL